MDLNSYLGLKPILVGFAGISTGCISALSYFLLNSNYTSADSISLLLRFIPGLVFGLATAVIFYKSQQEQVLLRLFAACTIVITGLSCYQIAYVTVMMSGDTQYAIITAPILTVIGGSVSTFAFIFQLHFLTKKYSGKLIKLSISGGVIGLLLIYTMTYDYGAYIFFIGWQATMLLLISQPMLKKTDEQITMREACLLSPPRSAATLRNLS